MQRIKDIYYTDRRLEGNIPVDGIKQASPQFFQGEDVRLSFYLNLNGSPVLLDKYNIEVILKKSPAASNVLWKGVAGTGLYNVHSENDGFYYLLMPASASSLFLPGTYYIDAKVTEKTGVGTLVKDVTTIIPLGTITIELGAASPNPHLRPTKTEEVVFDPVTGITTVTIHTTESTLPQPINVI